MASPPSYEESALAASTKQHSSYDDSKPQPQSLSIREELTSSRSQHVAAVVCKLLPLIRERAAQGLSRSCLLVIPSDQEAARKGSLVDITGETQTLVQLEGRNDSLTFWTQEDALAALKLQLYDSLAAEEQLPERSAPPPAVKSCSVLGRRQKATGVESAAQPGGVSVEVRMEEAHFRSETPFGLFETLRCRCVGIEVVVR